MSQPSYSPEQAANAIVDGIFGDDSSAIALQSSGPELSIHIKDIGFNLGTSGWLRKQLTSGTMSFAESYTSQSHQHCLILRSASTSASMLLACQNFYNLQKCEFSGCDRYEVVTQFESFDPFFLTDAARAACLEVAQKWCELKNSARENDAPLTISVQFHS